MAIDPRVDIGHVHLKVSDIERALDFYCGVLGFDLQQRYGTQAAFVSAGGYHHHLGLNTWESAGGSPPPRNATGLYHVAIRYPDRRTLADALRRILDAGIPLDGASDHGVSEALYLRDPDGNGIELYRDRPRDEWPRTADGKLEMVSERLDISALLSELDSADSGNAGAVAAGTSGAPRESQPRAHVVAAAATDSPSGGMSADATATAADSGHPAPDN
jgi:catechol 2,3-dioxygenase